MNNPAKRSLGLRRQAKRDSAVHRPEIAPLRVLVMGVGAFAHSTAQILRENGAEVSTYLTRDYAQYAPSLVGKTYRREEYPSPCPLLAEKHIELIVPMSIDWGQAPWKDELLASKVAIFSPT